MGQTITTLRDIFDQGYPPKSRFSVDDIPDLSGKVIIVTGGNAGIGKETVKALLQHDAKVYVASRNETKARDAIAELKDATGREALFLELDLASLQSVKKAAEGFLSKETQLHVLINNAGVMLSPIDLTSADGYDLQFGTNVLGHFYFTKFLLPRLIETAKNDPTGKARIVNVASSTHMFYGLNFDTFRDGPKRRKLGTRMLYCQSKFANIVVAKELARRYGDQGIVSTSLNPGNLKTDLTQHASWFELFFLNTFVFQPVAKGALTQLFAAAAPDGVNLNGQYLIPWARVGKARPDTGGPELGERLWAWLEEQVVDL